MVNGLCLPPEKTVPPSSHTSLVAEKRLVYNWVTGVIFPLAPQYGEGANHGSNLASFSSRSRFPSSDIFSMGEVFPSVNLPSEEILPPSDISLSCFLVEPEMPSTISNALSDNCEATELVASRSLQHQPHESIESTPAIGIAMDCDILNELPYLIEPFFMPLDLECI